MHGIPTEVRFPQFHCNDLQMCVAEAKISNDYLNKDFWPVRPYYQRLSAVINSSIFMFDISELQIIYAILRKIKSDGTSEVLIDWIIDQFYL